MESERLRQKSRQAEPTKRTASSKDTTSLKVTIAPSSGGTGAALAGGSELSTETRAIRAITSGSAMDLPSGAE